MSSRLSTSQKIGYAAGSVGTGGFSTVPGLLLLYYLTDELGVAAAAAGLVVLLPKAWDVVLNPFVGSWSDRTTSRWGARVPWMMRGAVLLPLAFAAMFWAPGGLADAGAALWVAGCFLLAATGFAFFQVPYIAQPAELTDDYAERTSLMTWRIALLTLAILVFGAGAPGLVKAGGDGLAGYRLMGVVCGTLFLIGFGVAILATRNLPTVLRAEPSGGLGEQLRAVAENRDFRVLFAAFVIQALGTSTALAGAAYVAEYLLGAKGMTTVLFVALVAPAILLVPVWRIFAARRGKQAGFRWATVLFLVGAVVMAFAGRVPTWFLLVGVAVAGTGYAGQQLFPLAMLPDTIQADALRTGRLRSGVFTGVWTAGETLGFALGPFLFAMVLALGGFVATTSGVSVDQPQSALTAIALGFGALPALLMLTSLPVLRRYSLTEASLADLAAQPGAR
ncbi:MFS transporter [Longivirga aurantiaca]|uniref:MFS transporter n=1 Tax=Longivirga aurantiaca TaxID=1837743 RepID=A0ABW1T0Y5_9ACTN